MEGPCSCSSCTPKPRWQQESHPDFDTVFPMLRQDGFLEEDRNRPFIGVGNTWNEIVPGHLHLRDLAEQAKLGIRANGGVGLEFGCVAPCDGFGNANPGYRYILPMRDNIADGVELMAQAHHFDGMVLLSSCDKSNPGVTMGLTGTVGGDPRGHFLQAARPFTPPAPLAWMRPLFPLCLGRQDRKEPR